MKNQLGMPLSKTIPVPVSLFPAGGEDITHTLLVLYAHFEHLAYVGVSLRVWGYVGLHLFVAPVISIDLSECPTQFGPWRSRVFSRKWQRRRKRVCRPANLRREAFQ